MDKTFFLKNRSHLARLLPTDAIGVISAATEMQQSSDANFPFRQDSNFWYLSGIDYPNCTLVLAPSQRLEQWQEILFVPDPDEFHDLWLGGSITPEAAKAVYGFKNVFFNSQKAEIMKQLIADSNTVLAPSYETFSDLQATPNAGPQRLSQQLKRYGAKQVESLNPLLTSARMVKSSAEIGQLEANVQLTLEAIKKVEQALLQAKTERDIEAVLSYEFTRAGARHGYGPIVGSGDNACIIHYQRNDGELNPGELVLIDTGAERNYYSADITRTLPVSGSLSPRQHEVYHAVEAVQRYALSLLKPGVNFLDYERSVREYMHQQLIKLKLLPQKATLRDTLQYFPHATSHHLGLDVHDWADLEQPLETNMVITVEPGIYIPEEKLGVRIEDDVVITEEGARLLS